LTKVKKLDVSANAISFTWDFFDKINLNINVFVEVLTWKDQHIAACC